MGSCYSCNQCNACNRFHNEQTKMMHQKQQEMEQLVKNNKLITPKQYIEHDIENDDEEDNEDDKFSLNTIRKERDEYDTFLVLSYLHSINYKHLLNEQLVGLIKQYTSQTKILLIETGQTVELQSDKHHIFHSIIINRRATLTVNPWNSYLKRGGTLQITCVSSVHLRKNASICLDSCGYKGGHCSYIEQNEEQFLDSVHDDIDLSDYDEEQQELRGCGIYASYSGESYKGLGLPNCIKNNRGGGGAGPLTWGSGGAAGYGTRGYKGQFDKQYSNKSCGKGGNVYGSHLLKPLYLGSGGGATCGGYDGGNGGGALKIECKNLVMDSYSVISCNGGNGKHTYLSGAGSGGSIYLRIKDGNDIKLHSNARIEALGGVKKELYGYGYKSDDVNNCGKGGYGRIRIQTFVNGNKLKKKLKNEYKYCIEPIPYIG